MVFETYTRVFVDAEALDQISAFYHSLLAGEETLRFAYPEAHLELAAVSSPQLSVLIIAGSAEARRPFEATRLTIKVDVLEPVLEMLAAAGAEQLEPMQPTPVGRKTRFKHVDGLIVEYVDHSASRILDRRPSRAHAGRSLPFRACQERARGLGYAGNRQRRKLAGAASV
jgi:hypothetical protein